MKDALQFLIYILTIINILQNFSKEILISNKYIIPNLVIGVIYIKTLNKSIS